MRCRFVHLLWVAVVTTPVALEAKDAHAAIPAGLLREAPVPEETPWLPPGGNPLVLDTTPNTTPTPTPNTTPNTTPTSTPNTTPTPTSTPNTTALAALLHPRGLRATFAALGTGALAVMRGIMLVGARPSRRRDPVPAKAR